MTTNQTIISIDPGREKCGLAAVHPEKGVLQKKIISTQDLPSIIKEWISKYKTNTVIMGNGTSSKEAKNLLEKILIDGQSLVVNLVDEYRTTDDGRRRYWQENPPQGFRRLIPVTMQTPPKPVDDYVAVILAERYMVIVNK
ncbi:Tex protein YqgF-like domain-containing protein [Pelosinus fermentans]|uniref:resolvase n=1 Tax=Pelosinus fermentans TaxID=365349 RepID=UPI0002685C0B|nr:resolvase [Pelosinus fermentans]OAM92752.1 Resolvase RNase H domain protein fold-containing protein [Pelosinus fermentans DSM 17108]SDQ55800.1 Tex protein YqgF-like domain-containing protein [Pelosinus fermentans]